MATFNNEQYADMIFMYGKADGSARGAKRLYQEKFPNRRAPYAGTIQDVYRRLRETGSCKLDKGIGRPAAISADVEVNVLEGLVDDPSTRTRKLAIEYEISDSSIWRIFKTQLLHPFHLQKV